MSGGTGHCVCGRIAYRVEGELRPVVNCHCEPCRRFTGHFLAAARCDGEDLEIDDDETLRWFRPSEHAEYGFCTVCGSSLFWRGLGDPGWISICAGTLDPPTGLHTTKALFVAHAGDYHLLDDSIPGLAEEG